MAAQNLSFFNLFFSNFLFRYFPKKKKSLNVTLHYSTYSFNNVMCPPSRLLSTQPFMLMIVGLSIYLDSLICLHTFKLSIFMPPLRSSRRHYAFGFSVRPYVRTSHSRDRVISRTDGWIPAKLKPCMYLAELMNWLDFGVTGSKVTGLIMYAKIACDHLSQEPIDGFLPNLGHVYI